MKPPRPVKFTLPGEKRGKKTRQQRRDVETPIHVSIYEFLRAVMLPGSIIHHSPNELGVALEEKHRIILISKWKRMGMMPGFPDLLVIAAQRDKPPLTFFIEVKADTELSQAQRDFREMAHNLGLLHCEARSVQDVEDFLMWEEIDTRIAIRTTRKKRP